MKNILVITSLMIWLALSGVSLAAELKPVTFNGSAYTTLEYKAIKTTLITKVKDRAKKKLTYDEYVAWVELVKKEVTETCKAITLTGVTPQNIVDKLNNFIATCK